MGAKVVLPDGPKDGVQVVVLGDRIAAVGAAPAVPPGAATVDWGGQSCRVVSLTGQWLTPGLVEVHSNLGLSEIGMERATVDEDAGQADPVRADFRAWEAYNPRSTAIPVTRMEGITDSVVMPVGGLIAGQAAWVRLAGDSQSAVMVKGPVAMRAGPGAWESRAQGIGALRELLEDARLWAKNQAGWEKNQLRPLAGSRLDLRELQRVLNKEVPLVISADRAADIEAVLRFAEEQGIRIVIAGGAEGWLVADRLAAAKVPVILDPLVFGPGSFDQVHGRAENPALLRKAGVTVLISTFSGQHARGLRQSAGNAVREGMSWQDAFDTITRAPAEVFGLPDRGRITAGAEASLVAWSGDPLELLVTPTALWIRGRDVPLRSRQTELLEKYRVLPGTPTAPR
jgi:imidazolonepropionase-like amidohydrolase